MNFTSRAYRVGEAALIAALAIATIFEVGRALAWSSKTLNLTEWLIDYSGEFVRRGLGGALVDVLSAANGVRADWVSIIISALVYPPVLLWFVWVLRRTFSRPILLSSAALGAPAFSSFLVRKDVFEIGLFVLLVLALRPGSRRWAQFVACWIVSVASVLIHEDFALLALLAATLISYRNRADGKPLRAAALTVAPGMVTFLLVVTHHGDAATAEAINAHWASL